MLSLRSFIAAHRVNFVATLVDENPNMLDMPEGSRHWRCVFTRRDVANVEGKTYVRMNKRRKLTVYFSQGPAIEHEPTAEDVLDCLASEASAFENARDFEDWASEFGYDTDSRKAERTYKAIAEQTAGLKRLFDETTYATLLWETERL